MNLGQLEQLEQLIAEIRQVSFTDNKTSLGSALALDSEEQLINAGESEFDVIVFGDLNHFKSLNDTHGHDAGDVAINEAGEAIRKLVIADFEAKAFRLSGDEFVILLKQSAVGRFVSAAAAFSSIKFFYNEKNLETAMSFGYVHNDSKMSFRDLMIRAETACHYAKVKGGGACIEWIEDMERNPLKRISGTCLNCAAKIDCNLPEQNAPPALKYCPCCGSNVLVQP